MYIYIYIYIYIYVSSTGTEVCSRASEPGQVPDRSRMFCEVR